MSRKKIQHHLDGLMTLLLFGVFAACVLIVLLTGANAYRRLTLRDQAAYDRRTCVQYLAARVRQADGLGAVTVEAFDGVPTLVLGADGDYVTRVYYFDGYLMELYAEAGQPMNPEDGEPVVAARGMDLSLQDGLLTATVTSPQGEAETLRLSLRSGEGAGS